MEAKPGVTVYEELNTPSKDEPSLRYSIGTGKTSSFRRASFEDLTGPTLSQMTPQTILEKLQTSIIDGSIQIPLQSAEGILINQVFGY